MEKPVRLSGADSHAAIGESEAELERVIKERVINDVIEENALLARVKRKDGTIINFHSLIPPGVDYSLSMLALEKLNEELLSPWVAFDTVRKNRAVKNKLKGYGFYVAGSKADYLKSIGLTEIQGVYISDDMQSKCVKPGVYISDDRQRKFVKVEGKRYSLENAVKARLTGDPSNPLVFGIVSDYGMLKDWPLKNVWHRKDSSRYYLNQVKYGSRQYIVAGAERGR